MRRLTGLLGAVAMAIIATGLAAQASPDFSGVWTVQSAPRGGRAGGRSGSLGSGWGPSFTISQQADKLTVERIFFSRGDLQPALKFRYSLDGSKTTNTVLMGRGMQEHRSTAAWQGDSLIITTTYSFANPEDGRTVTSELRQTLRLQRGRRLTSPPSLVVETTRSGILGGPPSTTRTVYTKPG